jgi:hypothetical protein
MISAVFKALDVFADRAVRRLFWLGVFGALLIQILLALILSYLIAQLRLVSLDWGVWGQLVGMEHRSPQRRSGAVLGLAHFSRHGRHRHQLSPRASRGSGSKPVTTPGCWRRANRESAKRSVSPSISRSSALG